MEDLELFWRALSRVGLSDKSNAITPTKNKLNLLNGPLYRCRLQFAFTCESSSMGVSK